MVCTITKTAAGCWCPMHPVLQISHLLAFPLRQCNGPAVLHLSSSTLLHRHMNGPVHEVQHIPRELDPELAASLPLGDPGEHELPTSQALHLSATAGEAREGRVWCLGGSLMR